MNNKISIYYCNWEENRSLSTALFMDSEMDKVEFNEKNYRLVDEIENKIILNNDEIEKIIADIDSDSESLVVEKFINELNKLWFDYNHHQKSFRSMCVGDVISFSSNDYEIKFVVKSCGFGLLL